MYHLPLLPGYAAGSNIRSSAPAVSPGAEDPSSGLSDAEEAGYQGSYFTSVEMSSSPGLEGFMPSASPETAPHAIPSSTTLQSQDTSASTTQPSGSEPILLSLEDIHPAMSMAPKSSLGSTRSRSTRRRAKTQEDQGFAEAIFFDYGVLVFCGFREDQELGIIEDVEAAGIMLRKIPHDDWEVEDFHYAVRSPLTPYCRSYS